MILAMEEVFIWLNFKGIMNKLTKISVYKKNHALIGKNNEKNLIKLSFVVQN
jgi:hypothetical protein